MTEPRKRRNHWGIGVWALYGGFVVFMLALAGWAATQRFDLVESNYYEKSLTYQDRIDQSQRVSKDGNEPSVTYDPASHEMTLCFDSVVAPTGTLQVHFYRTSDARRDFRIPLSIGARGCQTVADSRLTPGLWRVKCQWNHDGLDQYWENDLFVN